MLDQMTEVSDVDQMLVQARGEPLERIIQSLLRAPLEEEWKAMDADGDEGRGSDCVKRHNRGPDSQPHFAL